MAKEYAWAVTIDGVEHRVSCCATGNKYQIWVDDEDLTVVYRQSGRRMRNGLEQEVGIAGKTCLFVVWDERPDLVVDGVMCNRGKDYRTEKEKRKKGMIAMLWCIFAFALAVLGFSVVSLCIHFGEDNRDRINYGFYIIAALWIIVDATMQMKYWKEQ